MRILAISDLHGDSGLAAEAARIAEEQHVQAILLAGDLSLQGAEFENLIAPFARLDAPLLMLGGNHDDHERVAALAHAYGAIHLDGYGVVIDGVGFIGTRGLHVGGSRQDPREIRNAFRSAARYAGSDRLVSMSHTHPAGVPMGALSTMVSPSETIEGLIRELEPSVHVCGHLHEGAGLVETLGTTKVVNVAGAPTIIDL